MKKYYLLLIMLVASLSISAHDDWHDYVRHANRCARVNTRMYRQHMHRNYRMSERDLKRYYRFYGNNWGNVNLALEVAHASGRHFDDVCHYYKRYHRYGWERIFVELGIRPGTFVYKDFCRRLRQQQDFWKEMYDDDDDDYCSNRRHHSRHHKNYRHHRHDDDDDYDDDWDDDDDNDD